jgi:hypothetical protein
MNNECEKKKRSPVQKSARKMWTEFPQRKKIKDKSESYKYDILRIEDFWIFNIKNWRPEEYLPHK